MKRPEEALQIAVVAWLRVALPTEYRFHHSPNGGKRNIVEAARFKAMGTSAGFPDLIIIGRPMCFAIELKAGKGRMTPQQDAWQAHFYTAGWHVDTCRSLREVEAFLAYHGVPLRAWVTP